MAFFSSQNLNFFSFFYEKNLYLLLSEISTSLINNMVELKSINKESTNFFYNIQDRDVRVQIQDQHHIDHI